MEIFLKVNVTYYQNGKIYDSVLAETSNKQVPQYSQSEAPEDQYRICKGCGWKLNLLLFTHTHLGGIHVLKLEWEKECLWKKVVDICGIFPSNLHIYILTPTLHGGRGGLLLSSQQAKWWVLQGDHWDNYPFTPRSSWSTTAKLVW